MRLNIRHPISVAIFISISGCAAPPLSTVTPGQLQVRTDIDRATPTTVAADYAHERASGLAPRIGLALSGGGTRAGMFAYGVLAGLNDSGLLDRIDVISSVSGGSYAAYWLFARRLEAGPGANYQKAFLDCLPEYWIAHDDDRLQRSMPLMDKALAENGASFPKVARCSNEQQWSGSDDAYRRSAHLARHPDLFRVQPTVFTGTNGHGPYRDTAHLASDMALDFFRVEPTVPTAYQQAITTVWGLEPEPRQRANDPIRYANGTKGRGGASYVAEGHHTWAKLRELTAVERGAGRHLPLWILNTTVRTEKSRTGEDAADIFELTPYSYGSFVTGHMVSAAAGGTDLVPDLTRSVRASAAFADANNLSQARRAALELVSSTLLPSAKWGVTVSNPFGEGSLRLSDGGSSDNLGLLSLVRRDVRDIILVDAEADVRGRFETLCEDKTRLLKAGYDLSFGTTLDLDQVCRDPSKAFNTSAWLNPVVPGTISPKSPQRRSANDLLPTMRVWLIKLGWNQSNLLHGWTTPDCQSKDHPNSCLLTVFLGHNWKRDTVYLDFPQPSTTHATFNSSTPQFWAFRELGRTASAMLEVVGTGENHALKLRTDMIRPPLREQPVLCSTKDRAASCAYE